jgi:hypothetical protein
MTNLDKFICHYYGPDCIDHATRIHVQEDVKSVLKDPTRYIYSYFVWIDTFQAFHTSIGFRDVTLPIFESVYIRGWTRETEPLRLAFESLLYESQPLEFYL